MNLLPNGICSDWSFGCLLVSSDHRCGVETVEFCELPRRPHHTTNPHSAANLRYGWSATRDVFRYPGDICGRRAGRLLVVGSMVGSSVSGGARTSGASGEFGKCGEGRERQRCPRPPSC